MNFGPGADTRGERNHLHPILTKEESIVEHNINVAAQKFRRDFPDQFAADEDTADMLVVSDCVDQNLPNTVMSQRSSVNRTQFASARSPTAYMVLPEQGNPEIRCAVGHQCSVQWVSVTSLPMAPSNRRSAGTSADGDAWWPARKRTRT